MKKLLAIIAGSSLFSVLFLFGWSSACKGEVITDKDILDHNLYLDYMYTEEWDYDLDIPITKVIYNKVSNRINTKAISDNTTKEDSNTFRAYADGTFYQIGDTFYEVDYFLVSPQEFDLIYNDKFSRKPSFHSIFGTKYAIAQSVYSQAGDGVSDYHYGAWSTAHDATDGITTNYTGGDLNCVQIYDSTGASNFLIGRGFFAFDTSGITASYDVSSSSLHIYHSDILDNDNDAQAYTTIVESTQASHLQLVHADYDNVSTDELIDSGERKDISSIADDTAYTVYLFNSDGRDYINKTGYTKLSIREGHDVEDTPAVLGAGQQNRVQCYQSENSGTDHDPFLQYDLVEATAETGTTTAFSSGLKFINDITVITGYTEHYENSTATPDWIEHHSYRVPFFIYIYLIIPILWIGYRVILEFTIRWRK